MGKTINIGQSRTYNEGETIEEQDAAASYILSNWSMYKNYPPTIIRCDTKTELDIGLKSAKFAVPRPNTAYEQFLITIFFF